MIAKCECQHCGQHIEFEAESADQFCLCPTCGQQTRLRLPGKPFANTQAAMTTKSISRLTPQSAALKQIRGQSCYKALRVLISAAQIFCFIMAAVPALAGAFGFFSEVKGYGLLADASGIIFIAIISVFWIAVFIFLAIAGKQAALLLVDIADCQIRQVGKEV